MTSRGSRRPGDAAAAAAASARVAAILDQAAHVQLDVVVVAPPDAIAHRRPGRATRCRSGPPAADRLLDQAVAAARERVDRGLRRRAASPGTGPATDMAVSVARGPDRVAAAAALEEAVTAAVVEDLVDPETLDVLSASWGGLAEAGDAGAGFALEPRSAIASAPDEPAPRSWSAVIGVGRRG